MEDWFERSEQNYVPFGVCDRNSARKHAHNATDAERNRRCVRPFQLSFLSDSARMPG